MEIEINASECAGPAVLAQEIREKVSQLYVDWVWVKFPKSRYRVTPNTVEHVCRGLMMASELSEANAERIHGGAGDGKPSETPAPLDDASFSALPIARVIPHPWKKGETRDVYEFPVTRKIIIVADPIVPAAEILSMAKRCHDEEIGLQIMGGGYQMSLSLPNNLADRPQGGSV